MEYNSYGFPMSYDQIDRIAGRYTPSPVKSYNNRSFFFWCRSLFHRASSIITFENFPEEWKGNTKDFFYYCLFKLGYVAVFDIPEFGFSFQPATLSGQNFYYQPTRAVIANPFMELTKNEFEIGVDTEIIKLTPEYSGIWDVIEYYSAKLANMDSAIDMAITNSKIAFLLTARNKTAGEALKKMIDKINKGEPVVITDLKVLNDIQDEDIPWQYIEFPFDKAISGLKDLLMEFQSIINEFDAEIGIPVLPYQKKERMVQSEAELKIMDSTSRSIVWFECLQNSLEMVNKMFGRNIEVKLRYEPENYENNEEEKTNVIV